MQKLMDLFNNLFLIKHFNKFYSKGAGNMPTSRDDIMNELSNASQRGVILINVSQCLKGGVIELYETGKLSRYGIISGSGV